MLFPACQIGGHGLGAKRSLLRLAWTGYAWIWVRCLVSSLSACALSVHNLESELPLPPLPRTKHQRGSMCACLMQAIAITGGRLERHRVLPASPGCRPGTVADP